MAEQVRKIVLAYSGSLNISVIISWLEENYEDCEIIAVAADVDQGDDELTGLEGRARRTGTSGLYIADLKKAFVEDYIWPTLKASAVCESKYLLGTSFVKPITAKRLVEIARAEDADAICRDCTGEGNDQVRFELTIRALVPGMTVTAPWKVWDIKSREEEIEYAGPHNTPLNFTKETSYSRDKNLWHLLHESLDLENPADKPHYNKGGSLELSISPEQAPNEPTYITLSFERSVPTKLNSEALDGIALIGKLNELGGKSDIGIIDLVENRPVGMKSRGVYETLDDAILYHVHNKLEEITLGKETYRYKQGISLKFADIVHDGQWFTPLRQALSAFVGSTQQYVTGNMELKLYRGNIIDTGIASPYSPYGKEVAMFNESQVYNQADAIGFINLFGLPLKVMAQKGKS